MKPSDAPAGSAAAGGKLGSLAAAVSATSGSSGGSGILSKVRSFGRSAPSTMQDRVSKDAQEQAREQAAQLKAELQAQAASPTAKAKKRGSLEEGATSPWSSRGSHGALQSVPPPRTHSSHPHATELPHGAPQSNAKTGTSTRARYYSDDTTGPVPSSPIPLTSMNKSSTAVARGRREFSDADEMKAEVVVGSAHSGTKAVLFKKMDSAYGSSMDSQEPDQPATATRVSTKNQPRRLVRKPAGEGSGRLHVSTSGRLPASGSGRLPVSGSGRLPVSTSGRLPVSTSGRIQVSPSARRFSSCEESLHSDGAAGCDPPAAFHAVPSRIFGKESQSDGHTPATSSAMLSSRLKGAGSRKKLNVEVGSPNPRSPGRDALLENRTISPSTIFSARGAGSGHAFARKNTDGTPRTTDDSFVYPMSPAGTGNEPDRSFSSFASMRRALSAKRIEPLEADLSTLTKKDFSDKLEELAPDAGKRRIEDFVLLHENQILGKGGQSVIYKGKKSSGTVAVKRILCVRGVDETEERRMLRLRFARVEAEVLAMVTPHPHIVVLEDVFDSRAHFDLVLECLDGPNLFEFMTAGQVSENAALVIMRQVASAIAHLHMYGIAHRDLKPQNVVFRSGTPKEDDFWLKLIDFGLVHSKVHEDGDEVTAKAGTYQWMAPEQIARKPHPAAGVDVWAMGVMLYILVESRYPFYAKSMEELERNICSTNMRERFSCSSADVSALTIAMLAVDFTQRPSAAEVLQRLDKIIDTRGLSVPKESSGKFWERTKR